MKFTAPRKDLTEAITRAVQGLPARPSVLILAGMLVTADEGDISLTCSDGEVTFRADLSGDVEEPGSAVLPGRLLSDISRLIPKGDLIELRSSGRIVTLEAGSSRYELLTIDGDYPLSGLAAQPLGTTNGDDLKDALLKVTPVAADRNVNPVFATVRLELNENILSAVATSGYALAHMPVETELLTTSPVEGVLIPVWVAERFARQASGYAVVGWDHRVITLGTDGLTVTSRTISGQYPKWGMILGHEGPWTTVSTAELVRAVKVAQLVAADDRVALEFDGNDLWVRSRGQGECTEYVECDYEGEPVSFSFGASLLLSGLSGCGEDTRLGFTAPPRPMLMESGGYRFMAQPRKEM
jgi:DNA polymerase III subunit beta